MNAALCVCDGNGQGFCILGCPACRGRAPLTCKARDTPREAKARRACSPECGVQTGGFSQHIQGCPNEPRERVTYAEVMGDGRLED